MVSILIILVVLEVFLVILKVFMGILVILIVLGFLVILKVSKRICIWVFLVVLGYFYHFFFLMNKLSSLRQKEYTKKFTPTKQVAIKLQTPQIIYIILTVSWGYFGNLDVVEIL